MRRVIWVAACEIRPGDVLLCGENEIEPDFEAQVEDADWDHSDMTFCIRSSVRGEKAVTHYYDPVEQLRFVVSGSKDFPSK